MDFVERLKLERKAKTRSIYYRTQIQMAYNSNKIEGSKLTEKQTMSLFDTKQFVPNDDSGTVHYDNIIEAVNHFRAFDYVLNHIDVPVSIKLVKELHRIMKSGTSDEDNPLSPIGAFKKYENEVGEITTSHPDNVKNDLDDLILWYETLKTKTLNNITEFHVRYEKIHPFADGNGRTGRLLIFKECVRNNIMPFIVLDELKEYYYKGLHEWQTANKTTRLMQTFESCQESYEKYIRKMGFNGNIRKE